MDDPGADVTDNLTDGPCLQLQFTHAWLEHAWLEHAWLEKAAF
jgi:hypothetical protein